MTVRKRANRTWAEAETLAATGLAVGSCIENNTRVTSEIVRWTKTASAAPTWRHRNPTHGGDHGH